MGGRREPPAPYHHLNNGKPSNLNPCPHNTSHPPNSRPICGKLGAREGPVQPRPESRIADAFGSRLEQVVRRLSREHLTLGIILVVLGVFAFQISPWLAWVTIWTGVLLLTWDSRMRR